MSTRVVNDTVTGKFMNSFCIPIVPFPEGNTRTTAVFFIKYLRTLGFDVTNNIFAENAWYFRNSLVKANYNDLKNGVHETTEFLELFLCNLLLNESNPLHNRTLHISGTFKKTGKPDIDMAKPDIEALKPDIEKSFQPKTESLSRCLDTGKVSIDSVIRRFETVGFRTCSLRARS